MSASLMTHLIVLRNSPFEDSKFFFFTQCPSTFLFKWNLTALAADLLSFSLLHWELTIWLYFLAAWEWFSHFYCICFITMLTKVWQKSFFYYVNITCCLIKFQDINWVYTILKSLLTQELFPNTWKVSFWLEKKLYLTERIESQIMVFRVIK